jgi:hypothetical protein
LPGTGSRTRPPRPPRSGNYSTPFTCATPSPAQRETAQYIVGEREADYFLFVKGSRSKLQKAVFDAIRADGGTARLRAPSVSASENGRNPAAVAERERPCQPRSAVVFYAV